MSAGARIDGCRRTEEVCAYTLGALPGSEIPALEEHIASCIDCTRELRLLRPVLNSFIAWPADVLRPAPSLQARLALRIAAGSGGRPVLPARRQSAEPSWQSVTPGISVKLLATDEERHILSMLVRLAPGADYPPHTHAGVEELHLLSGELWIDDRKLFPGDYNRAEPGTGDKRVWSETGCTCVLVTSAKDILR